MILKYGNQQVEFWTNIKEQIDKSPHKEQALKDVIFDDEPPSEESIEHAQYCKERIEELESQYSMIWRIRIQISKGQRTSKVDLDYVNEVHREIALGEY